VLQCINFKQNSETRSDGREHGGKVSGERARTKWRRLLMERLLAGVSA